MGGFGFVGPLSGYAKANMEECISRQTKNVPLSLFCGTPTFQTKKNTCLIEANSVVVRVSACAAVAASASGVDADAAVGVAEVAIAVGKARIGDHFFPSAKAVEVGSGALFGLFALIVITILKKLEVRNLVGI